MHPQIKNLLKLQGLDGRLEILLKELKSRPDVVEAQGGKVSGFETRSHDIAARILDKRREIDRAELDIKSQDAKIEDSKKNINAMKSNHDYAALMKQIARFEEERGTIEEALLGLWDEMEALEGENKELQKDLAEAQVVLVDEQKSIDIETEEIRVEATRFMEQREAARTAVDVEILEIYDMLFSRYRDRSVVSAEGGVCSGCHMSLNPQTTNQLRGSSEMVTCKNCSRILYL